MGFRSRGLARHCCGPLGPERTGRRARGPLGFQPPLQRPAVRTVAHQHPPGPRAGLPRPQAQVVPCSACDLARHWALPPSRSGLPEAAGTPARAGPSPRSARRAPQPRMSTMSPYLASPVAKACASLATVPLACGDDPMGSVLTLAVPSHDGFGRSGGVVWFAVGCIAITVAPPVMVSNTAIVSSQQDGSIRLIGQVPTLFR